MRGLSDARVPDDFIAQCKKILVENQIITDLSLAAYAREVERKEKILQQKLNAEEIKNLEYKAATVEVVGALLQELGAAIALAENFSAPREMRDTISKVVKYACFYRRWLTEDTLGAMQVDLDLISMGRFETFQRNCTHEHLFLIIKAVALAHKKIVESHPELPRDILTYLGSLKDNNEQRHKFCSILSSQISSLSQKAPITKMPLEIEKSAPAKVASTAQLWGRSFEWIFSPQTPEL